MHPKLKGWSKSVIAITSTKHDRRPIDVFKTTLSLSMLKTNVIEISRIDL